MRAILFALLNITVACGLAAGAEPEPPHIQALGQAVALIKAARQLSDMTYYQELYVPLDRRLYVADDGAVSVRLTYAHRKDETWAPTDEPGGYVVTKGPVPARDDLLRAAAMYQEVLDKWTRGGRNGERLLLPFELLGKPLGQVGDVIPEYEVELDAAKRGYGSLPSRLDALCYLELALIQEELGNTEEYRRILEKSVRDLDLMSIDFRYDVGFRHLLASNMNFERPECCLLFLAAEDARLGEKLDVARERYATLIKGAPGSPLAWEALVKVSLMEAADAKEMQQLTQVLLDTYPLVWGCSVQLAFYGSPIRDAKLNKEQFAAQLPAILKKAGEEEVMRHPSTQPATRR